ncbi:MAG: acyltransferase family protein [Roseburia sp.]|nr:acyltransferase family protein [Roseburia sp.]
MGEKKEFIAVDICKLFWALVVVAVHLLPMADVWPESLFWFNQIFGRIAVPYYFVASGYFLAGKLNDKRAVRQQVFHLTSLYGVYTLLHLNLIIKDFKMAGTDIYNIVTELLFLGSYVHLWYLLALILGIVILYFIVQRFKEDTGKIVLIAVVIYVFGTLGNAYSPLMDKVPVYNVMMNAYLDLFKTTRNGIFMGVPFLTMGYIMKKREILGNGKPYLVLLALLLMTVEVYTVKHVLGLESASMYFILPLVVYACYSWSLSIRIHIKYKEFGVVCRKVSFLVYALHMFVHKNLGHYVYYRVNSLGYYIIIVGSTMIAALVIIWLSKYKYFKWLRYLY